jgi:Putative adhesin
MPRAGLLVAISLWHGATTAHAQGRAVSRGWRAAVTAAIKVHAPTGSVIVEGWDRDSVDLTGALAEGETVFGGGSAAGLKLGAEGTAVRGASRLVIHVPWRARLTVRSGAAEVEIRGVTGTVDIGAAAGNVMVSGELESVIAESISGTIRIAATTRSVRARTTRGTLDVAGQIAEAQLSSVGGEIHVSGQPLGRLRIETIDGGVHVAGRVAASGSLDIETFGGAVRIELPADQQATLDLRTSSAEITGHVDASAGRSAIPNIQSLITRTGSVVSLVHTLGAPTRAAPPITVRTFRGRITIEAQRQRR